MVSGICPRPIQKFCGICPDVLISTNTSQKQSKPWWKWTDDEESSPKSLWRLVYNLYPTVHWKWSSSDKDRRTFSTDAYPLWLEACFERLVRRFVQLSKGQRLVIALRVNCNRTTGRSCMVDQWFGTLTLTSFGLIQPTLCLALSRITVGIKRAAQWVTYFEHRCIWARIQRAFWHVCTLFVWSRTW